MFSQNKVLHKQCLPAGKCPLPRKENFMHSWCHDRGACHQCQTWINWLRSIKLFNSVFSRTGSLFLTEPCWTGYCKLNCQVVRIMVSFNFLKVFPYVKLSFINFFSSGIKSVFCTAAWSKLLWPNLGISEGGDLSWALSCLLEHHF